MTPLAVKGPEAAFMLGISSRKFRILERQGCFKKHPATGTYPVAMLEEFISSGDSKSRWSMGGEEESQRAENIGVRNNKRRSKRKPSPTNLGILDSAVDRLFKAENSS